MKIARRRFNIYLLAACATLGAIGCRSTGDKRDKQISTLNLHLEVNPDRTELSGPVPIYREKPVMVNVEKAPFLTEANIADAQVIGGADSFVLRVQFDKRGTWLLEQYSAVNPRKRLATFSRWGKKLNEGRWLAAPIIPRRISDGALTFTPDATREEAEEIARGLRNLAAKVRKKSKW